MDGIGLAFDTVSTELNALATGDPKLWVLGKLYAYRAQNAPFIHLDTDAILWKRLPPGIENAPVIAQNPEPFTIGASHYQPHRLQHFITQGEGWLPPEWEWSLSFGGAQRAENCGIFGGNHVEFINHFARSAIKLVEDERNQASLSQAGKEHAYTLEIEQFYLSACLDYHRSRPDTTYRDLNIRYLFDSFGEAFNPNIAAKVGFTHFLSSAKMDGAVAKRIEQRVKRDYPHQYRRCLRFAKTSGDG